MRLMSWRMIFQILAANFCTVTAGFSVKTHLMDDESFRETGRRYYPLVIPHRMPFPNHPLWSVWLRCLQGGKKEWTPMEELSMSTILSEQRSGRDPQCQFPIDPSRHGQNKRSMYYRQCTANPCGFEIEIFFSCSIFWIFFWNDSVHIRIKLIRKL